MLGPRQAPRRERRKQVVLQEQKRRHPHQHRQYLFTPTEPPVGITEVADSSCTPQPVVANLTCALPDPSSRALREPWEIVATEEISWVLCSDVQVERLTIFRIIADPRMPSSERKKRYDQKNRDKTLTWYPPLGHPSEDHLILLASSWSPMLYSVWLSSIPEKQWTYGVDIAKTTTAHSPLCDLLLLPMCDPYLLKEFCCNHKSCPYVHITSAQYQKLCPMGQVESGNVYPHCKYHIFDTQIRRKMEVRRPLDTR